MNITCDFSNNGTDCSHVFEGVHISITIFQAIFALVIFLLAFPLNILLITAMIIYRHLLDKTILVTISFLISNTVIGIGSSQIFITSMLRAWIFGYWGCQVFSFMTVVAKVSRYATVGLVCIARFIKVFFPHSNQLKLLAGFLTGSWLFAFFAGLLKFFSGSTGFDVSNPGCGFASNFDTLSDAYRGVFLSLLICITFIGAILPIILYTIMYFKARQLRKIVPTTQPVIATDPQIINSQKRWRRANITYILLVLAFGFFSLVIFAKISAKAIFRKFNASPSVVVGIFFILTDIGELYILADIVILIINRDERKVLFKLIKRIYSYFNMHKNTVQQ